MRQGLDIYMSMQQSKWHCFYATTTLVMSVKFSKKPFLMIGWKGIQMKVSIDFDYVPASQDEIHARLENWQRWVRVRPHGWHVAPMFRQAQSNSRQWHPPEVRPPVDSLDAVVIEKAVSALPDKHKTALRWFYVARNSPTKIARGLGLTLDALFDTVIDARNMLRNRT